MMAHHENHHRPFTPPRHGGDGGGGANVAERTLQQPFDYVSATPSPSYSPGMAATLGLGLGYPFTQAQWKELERQAMIYKYMVASLPVPPDLLLPLTTDSRFSLNSGYSLRFGRNGDPEPGRCKRTDGKKWRCSRDAAPDQKYCERHLNRGRPRSRKPVEVSTTTNKKNRNVQPPNPLPAASTNPTSHGTAVNSQAPMFLNCGSSVDFEPSSSLLPHKEPRGMDWLMIGEPHFSEDSLNLNSSASGYSSGKVNHFNECLFSLNSDVIIPMEKPHNTDTTPRGFIDAWSDNSKQTPVSTAHEKLSLSAEDEMGRIHMGLGFTNWNHPSDAAVSKCHPPCWVGSGSWISSAPGGPLAEVLQHRTASPSSGSPLMSSPSGVLQKKVASLSDSSGEGSSPALEPEITLQWFNSTS